MEDGEEINKFSSVRIPLYLEFGLMELQLMTLQKRSVCFRAALEAGLKALGVLKIQMPRRTDLQFINEVMNMNIDMKVIHAQTTNAKNSPKSVHNVNVAEGGHLHISIADGGGGGGKAKRGRGRPKKSDGASDAEQHRA